MQIRYLPEAEAELGAQVEYLNEHAGVEAVQSFLAVIDSHAGLLLRFPRLGSVIAKLDDARRLRLGSFQTSLIYAIEGEEIVILAVAHYRREPGYWRGRLGQR